VVTSIAGPGTAVAVGVAICQSEAGVPGLPLLVNVVPFISQM
jgi:hypothetical protein